MEGGTEGGSIEWMEGQKSQLSYSQTVKLLCPNNTGQQ